MAAGALPGLDLAAGSYVVKVCLRVFPASMFSRHERVLSLSSARALNNLRGFPDTAPATVPASYT